MSTEHTASLVVGFHFPIGEVRARSRALFPDFEDHEDFDASLSLFAKEAGCGKEFAYANYVVGEGMEDEDTVFLVVESNSTRLVENGEPISDTINFSKLEILRPKLIILRSKLIDMGLSVGDAQIAISRSVG
jgi:hypothetical protein